MAMNNRWLCWMLMGVMCILCLNQGHAQEVNDLGGGLSELKLGTERPDVRAMLNKLGIAVGAVLVLGGIAIYVTRVVVPRLGPVSRKRVKSSR